MFLRDKGGRRQPPDRLPMYLISLCTLYLLYAHYIYIIIYYYILCATYFMLLSITVAEWCYKDFQLGVTQVNKGK